MGFVKNLGNVATLGVFSKGGGPLGRMFNGPEKVGLSDQDAAAFNDPTLAANQHKIGQAIAGVQGQAPTQINAAPQDQFRSDQLGLVNTLQDQVAGRAPSVAQTQLQQGLDQNIQAQASNAASQRGVSAGLVARNLANGVNQANQATNGQAAMLRAGEQSAATQNLGSVLNAGRGTDVGLATNQAQLSAQEQQAHNDLTQKYLAMGLSLDQAQFQAQQDLAKTKLGVQAGNVQRQQSSDAALLGAGASLGASLLTGK